MTHRIRLSRHCLIGLLTAISCTLLPRDAAAQKLVPFSIQPPPKALSATTPKPEEVTLLPPAIGELCNYLALNKPSTDLGTVNKLVTAASSQENLAALDAWARGHHRDLSRPAGVSEPAWAIGACGIIETQIAYDIQADTTDGHAAFVAIDLALSHLGRWLRSLDTTADAEGTTQARGRLDDTLAELHKLMQSHGLLNRFSAAGFFGTASGGSGRVLAGTGTSDVRARITESDTLVPLSKVTIETAHFGWESIHAFDGSLRTQIGFQPVLNVVKVGTDGSTNPALVAVLQTAFSTSVGGRVGFPVQRVDGEISWTLQVGANRLSSDPVTFDSKTPALITTPVNPAGSQTAWSSETGVEFTLFDNPVRVLHAEKGLVNPAVSIATGYRYDGRFSPANIPGLTVDPNRFYFRFMVDAIKTLTDRAIGAPAKAFDLGFGVEYERPMHGSSQMPGSTRFVIRGDINLLKATATDTPAPKASGGSL